MGGPVRRGAGMGSIEPLKPINLPTTIPAPASPAPTAQPAAGPAGATAPAANVPASAPTATAPTAAQPTANPTKKGRPTRGATSLNSSNSLLGD